MDIFDRILMWILVFLLFVGTVMVVAASIRVYVDKPIIITVSK